MNFSKLVRCGLTLVSPKLNTKVCYRVKFGRSINLKDPDTLDEKILKMKLEEFGTDELVRECADKYRVRSYIERKGCKEILVPLIAAYDKAEEIDWETLPNRFAMKWNFGCGFNIICADKNKMNKSQVIDTMRKWGKTDYYLEYSELQYKNVKKKIIVEQFLDEGNGSTPSDYKIYCFNGKPYCVMLCTGRESGHAKYYFFDKNWNFLRINRNGKEAPEGFSIPKPAGIDMAFEYAERLCEPFKFVRVDLYLVQGRVYFGELTFTPSGGMDSSRLPETDLMFGKMLHI